MDLKNREGVHSQKRIQIPLIITLSVKGEQSVTLPLCLAVCPPIPSLSRSHHLVSLRLSANEVVDGDNRSQR